MAPRLTLDLKKVSTSYNRLNKLLPSVRLHYAIKCNPHIEVLKTLQATGASFEVASSEEIMILEQIGGVNFEDVIFSNPVKSETDIVYAYNVGIRTFSFDCSDEIRKLTKLAPNSRVFLRLASLTHQSVVDSEGKFGVDQDTGLELMHLARLKGLDPVGIGFHVGSQMTDILPWEVSIRSAIAFIMRLKDEGITIGMLNIGGGFPSQYKNTPKRSLEMITSSINSILNTEIPYKLNVVAEPGRSIVAEAGTVEAEIIGIAKRFGKNWLHLNVGAFNGLIEALETRNALEFPVYDSQSNEEKKLYNLTGPTCDSQDTILYEIELSSNLKPGDIVYIKNAGAYTTAYTGNFNGFQPPIVRII